MTKMTTEEFCAIQDLLNLSNTEMAEALGGRWPTMVDKIRGGHREPAIRIAEMMRSWMHPDYPEHMRPRPGRPRPEHFDVPWSPPPPPLDPPPTEETGGPEA